MSAYANDARVTDLRTGQYIVQLDNGGLVDIEREMTAVGPGFLRYPRKGTVVDWPADGIPDCDRKLIVFTTADDAIHSLIGDPR